MLEQSYLFQDGPKKLSKEEQQAGNKLFLCVVALIFLVVFIFFIGQFFKTWNAGRAIAIGEMRVNRQYLFAQGQITRVLPAKDAVYFTGGAGAAWRMLRSLPSWTVVAPETMTAFGERWLGMDDAGQWILLQQEDRWFIKDLMTGECTEVPLPEAGAEIVRADFCADGTRMLAEVKTSSDADLWQYDCRQQVWENIGQGNHAEYTRDAEWIYYERQGEIFRFNVKKGTEEFVAPGYLPALSSKGTYLSYVTRDAASGEEAVWVCRMDDPEEAFLLSRHEAGAEAAGYQEIAWEYRADALYVSETMPDDTVRVKYYELGDTDIGVSEQASVWMEACLMGDAETAKMLFPQDPYQDEMIQLQEYGLGFYAPEKENGLEGSGMYQKMACQFLDPESEWPYAYWNGKLYFRAGTEGYDLERYLSREKSAYALLEDNRVYQKDDAGQQTQVAEITGTETVVGCAYNEGHDNLLLIQKQGESYQMTSINEDGIALSFPVEVPETMEPYAVSFSHSGHVGALFCRSEETQAILILNLKKNKQIPSDFLLGAQKAFWKNNQLILFSGDDTLKVRWVYAPSEGTLQLHEDTNQSGIF